MLDEPTTSGVTENKREQPAALPLVSVITIFLDAERFIEEAIESVFAQTWPHWELLLVDDGSTDRSTAIARRYAAEYPDRIRYLEHPGHANRGKSVSRNLGVAHATGKYVAFLDADDVFLPERLERHAAILERHGEVDVVQSVSLWWRSWAGGAEPDTSRVYVCAGSPIPPIVAPPSLLGNIVGTLPFGPPGICSLTIRTSALSRIGTFEDRFHSIYEDQVLYAKIYTHATVYLLDEVLDRYRQHAQSSLATALRAGVWHWQHPNSYRHAFLDWLNQYLAVHDVSDQAIRRAAAALLRPYQHPLPWRLPQALVRLPLAARTSAGALAYRLLPEVAFERVRRLYRRRVEASQRARVYRLEGLYGPLHIRMKSDGR